MTMPDFESRLIQNYSKFIHSVIWRYMRAYGFDEQHHDDVYQEACLSFLDYVRKHEITHDTLTSIELYRLKMRTRYAARKYFWNLFHMKDISKRIDSSRGIVLSDIINGSNGEMNLDKFPFAACYDDVSKLDIDSIASTMTKREKQVLHYLNSGYTKGEVAQIIGVKPWTVSRLVLKIQEKLRQTA